MDGAQEQIGNVSSQPFTPTSRTSRSPQSSHAAMHDHEQLVEDLESEEDLEDEEYLEVQDEVEHGREEGDDIAGDQGRKFLSGAWKEYTRIRIGGVVTKGQCKYCDARISAKRGVGTSALLKHLKRCKARKKALRVVDQLHTTVMSPDGVILRDWKFEHEVSRKEMCRMIILHELPFSIVEYDGFRKFVSSLNPLFKMVSRTMVKNDCIKEFDEQKEALREVFKSIKSRISLSMDLWTSNQTLGYMCITCHFIDDDWKLQKRIIKFSDIRTPHTGVAMFNVALKSIQEWHCEDKLFAITLDNASNNDTMAGLLKTNLLEKHILLGKGRLFHQRCAAHVSNLICQAGFSFMNSLVCKIRESVKYIHGSSTRKQKFEDIVTQLGINGKRPSLDVPTRWNSTYHMLETSSRFKRAFDLLSLQDVQYVHNPSYEDWECAEILCKLFKVFYEATKVISGSKYPTSNLWFHEIWQVKFALEKEDSNDQPSLHDMITYMKKKFDKYWKASWLELSLPVLLDPRFKIAFLEFRFQGFGDEATPKLAEVKKIFQGLFNEYSRLLDCHVESVQQGGVDVDNIDGSDPLADWDRHLRQRIYTASDASAELETYLAKPPLPRVDHFDILHWWKMNSSEYPTLARHRIQKI